MHKKTINIITRCTRVNNLYKIKEDIIKETLSNIIWHVIIDTNIIKNIPISIITLLQEDFIKVYYKAGSKIDMAHQSINDVIDQITEGYIYILDDDNKLHPKLISTIEQYNSKGFLFNQYIGFKDFTNKEYRIILQDNIKVRHVDMAQFIMDKTLIGSYRIPQDQYIGDGLWIEEIYKNHADDFTIIPEVLCYYNYYQEKKEPFYLPKVLYYGDDQPEMRTTSILGYEETALNVKYFNHNTINFYEEVKAFDPDSIISTTDNCTLLSNLPLDYRQRWIHLSNTDNIGDIAYNCAMNYILNVKHTELVSYITPTYNTGDKIKLSYQSLLNQSNPNWEWVIVDDSTDNGITLEIINEISKNDPRVKIYDFNNKSGGVIGEAKYRACVLSKGNYIAEFDHDDYLMPDCTEYIIRAFNSNPDVGFVYSDCVELLEDWTSHTYEDGFALGYGKYRKEQVGNHNWDIVIQQNINPKTIRHIVGVPNHVRVWKRDAYFTAGGHNRRLTIADDYELIVRTFLTTRMMHIPVNLYLQFLYNNTSGQNTHDLSRADIQRRVFTISNNYNEQIKNRFEQLGIHDWAYEANPTYPILANSRFGDEEGKANLTYEL